VEGWQQRLGDEEAALYPIGVVAELLNVDVQVIRRYDDTGIVRPERSQSGQRRYSRRDIARLAHVLNLADEGVSLPGIKRILDLEAEVTALRKEAGNEQAEQG
jgi:MerR family transcriptional regulator, heat shock protein HspR